MRRHPGTFAAGVLFMAIGIAYLLEALEVWDVRLGRLWPVALIVIGAVVILSDRFSADHPEPKDLPADPFTSEDR